MNNRNKIAALLMELEKSYEDLDKFFYSNFKFDSLNRLSYIEAKKESIHLLFVRAMEVKKTIKLLEALIQEHTGGWFDSEEKRNLDIYLRNKVFDIKDDFEKLYSLFNSFFIM